MKDNEYIPKIHHLKILPEYFEAVLTDDKKFEVRFNDRDYQTGDVLVLKEWNNKFTGREITRTVTYVIRAFEGLKYGYVIMSIG